MVFEVVVVFHMMFFKKVFSQLPVFYNRTNDNRLVMIMVGNSANQSISSSSYDEDQPNTNKSDCLVLVVTLRAQKKSIFWCTSGNQTQTTRWRGFAVRHNFGTVPLTDEAQKILRSWHVEPWYWSDRFRKWRMTGRVRMGRDVSSHQDIKQHFFLIQKTKSCS